MSDEAALNVEDLRAFYGEPHLLARDKVLPRLDRHCRDFIARSPFLVLGTADAQGNQDVSPRGDPPGFVKVLADGRLAIPDRPGNRRVDCLTNIAANPKVALLFMVPGFDETVRVNGRADRDPRPGAAELAGGAGPAGGGGDPGRGRGGVLPLRQGVRCARPCGIRPAAPTAAQMPTLGRIIADQIRGRRCGRGGRRRRRRHPPQPLLIPPQAAAGSRSAGTCAAGRPRPSRS